MSSIVWHSYPLKFALTLRKIGSSFALDFALHNPSKQPRVEGGMVFNFFPDTASSLPVARGVTQVIN